MRRGHWYLRWAGAFLLVCMFVSVSPASPVRAAAPIVVDVSGDSDVPANPLNCPSVSPAHTCTLRDAVAKSVGGDTINFAPGLGTIHVTLAGGTIVIGHDLIIAGAGASTTIIDAEPNTQPFAITGPNTLSTSIPVAANVTFRDLTIQNVSVTDGFGGAILVQSSGTLTLTNATFLNNSNANDSAGYPGGGAILLNSFLRPDLSNQLLSAPLIITNCTFTGNQTDFGGGAIEWNGPISITNSTFTSNINNGGSDGGAILDAIVGPDRPTAPTGVVTVSHSTFANNSIMSGDGGAISANAIVATDVTFRNNQTINGVGGGALELHNNNPSTGPPPASTLVNVTFDGNMAGAADSVSGEGGAIELLNGSLTLLNVTIANNSAGVTGGGVTIESGSLTLGNTIIAGNSAGIFGPDVSGPVTSLGNNLIGTIPGSSGWGVSDKTGGPGGNTNPPNLLDARLNPLGNNGGTTQNRLPLPGSPALDVGSDSICNTPSTVNKLDQRGVARPIGAHCDIGATEGTGGLIVPVAGTTPQQAAVGAVFAPALAATVEDPGGTPLGSGISVTFTVIPVGGAGGSFAGNAATATAPTNASGVATAPAFTANITPGTYTVTANLTAGPLGTAATFTLTNTVGAPSSITPNTGTTPQSAPGGAAFAILLAATVFDSSSNHVGSGLSVTFTINPVGGAGATFPGNATTAVVNTGVNGVATAPTLTANATPGSYTVTANLTSGPLATPATFALTNTVAVPSSISANTNTTPQSALINTAFSVPLSATVRDGANNPLSGIVVTFTAPTSGPSGTFPGNLTTVTAMTNASGVATAPAFTANATVGGPYTVNAMASGVSTPAAFTLANTAATLTSIAITGSGGATSVSVKIGQVMQLTATGTFSDGSTQVLAVSSWVSSNLQAVSVDSSGRITALSPGSPVTITATFNGIPGQIVVTIIAPTLTGVNAQPAPAARPGGATSGQGGGPAANPIPASR